MESARLLQEMGSNQNFLPLVTSFLIPLSVRELSLLRHGTWRAPCLVRILSTKER